VAITPVVPPRFAMEHAAICAPIRTAGPAEMIAASTERHVAGITVPTSPTISTIAGVAALRVTILVPLSTVRAWRERAFTSASRGLSTAATGPAPIWVTILTTAAPAEMSAPQRPRFVTRERAWRKRPCALAVKRGARVLATTSTTTAATAARRVRIERSAVSTKTAPAAHACQTTRVRRPVHFRPNERS